MKKYIYGLLACALILSSCDYNDKHFKGLEDLAKPDNTSAVEYTLLPEDYSAISKNKDNVAFAKELDAKVETEDGTPSEIYQNALKAIASNESFGELITAADFAPNFLITKWYTKDNTAAIKLTYNEDVNKPEILTKLEQAHNYTLDGNDYEQIWGEAGIEYVTDKKPLNKSIDALLNAEYVDAQKDQYAVVNYQYSIIEPGQSGTDPVIFFENFDEFKDKDVPTWAQQNVLGGRDWQIRAYNNNSYLQFSANGSNSEEESYILTPSIKAQKDAFFSFDLKFRYYNGLPLSIMISDDYTDDVTKATWTDISNAFEFPVPADGGETPDFVSVGAYNLTPFADKKVVIAFVYKGNGIKDVAGAITTTVQIDEVQVSLEKPATRSATRSAESTIFNRSNVYKFNGTIWLEVNDVITLTTSDYQSMGIDKFGKANPKEYLPKYLSVRYPYAQADDLKTLVYRYDDGMGSAQYEYNGSSWIFVESFVPVTSQFVFSDGKWVYNPSTVVNLPAEKGNAAVSAFYQPITDWVWENIDQKELGITEKGKGYVTRHGNNDYYSGTSAFQNNVDIRTNKYIEQYAKGYTKDDGTVMSNDEILELVLSRLPDALTIGLKATYPNAAPVDNMEVIYTINFVMYDNTKIPYTIQYEVVGKGEFKYIEGSLKLR